ARRVHDERGRDRRAARREPHSRPGGVPAPGDRGPAAPLPEAGRARRARRAGGGGRGARRAPARRDPRRPGRRAPARRRARHARRAPARPRHGPGGRGRRRRRRRVRDARRALPPRDRRRGRQRTAQHVLREPARTPAAHGRAQRPMGPEPCRDVRRRAPRPRRRPRGPRHAHVQAPHPAPPRGREGRPVSAATTTATHGEAAASVAGARAVVGRRAWLPVAMVMFAVAWGGNEFTPLLVMYREVGHFSAVTVDALLAAYVLGIVPALLVGGPLSDRYGRRPLLLPAAPVALAGSLVLAGGESSAALLAAGRVLCGVALGLVMAVGTTWIKELTDAAARASGTSDGGSGARRAGLSLTLG